MFIFYFINLQSYIKFTFCNFAFIIIEIHKFFLALKLEKKVFNKILEIISFNNKQ